MITQDMEKAKVLSVFIILVFTKTTSFRKSKALETRESLKHRFPLDGRGTG